MEKVVYVLGAGFSAGLGIPVMNNFLERAKDMYYKDIERYSYFRNIFETIRNMSYAKQYYESDQTNIEEIFSILEMERFIGKLKSKVPFDRFICDVVNHYTPPISPYKNFVSNWQDQLFSPSEEWSLYGYWVLCLFHAQAQIKEFTSQTNTLLFTKCNEEQVQYSIVTLNYDTVLESVCNFIKTEYEIQDIDLNFKKEKGNNGPFLAKLHGSADDRAIIPPTWNKGLRHKHLLSSWRLAYNLLSNANYIRILGYSLPETDSYIKYLFKSAVLKSEHLKHIDIICWDPEGDVKKRYNEFITPKQKSFYNEKVQVYLNNIRDQCKIEKRGEFKKPLKFNKIEQGHKLFVESIEKHKQTEHGR